MKQYGIGLAKDISKESDELVSDLDHLRAVASEITDQRQKREIHRLMSTMLDRASRISRYASEIARQ